MQATELDGLCLLGRGEEHRTLTGSDVREKERLPDAPATPDDGELGLASQRLRPSLLEHVGLAFPVQESVQRHGEKHNADEIVVQGPCTTKPL